MCFQALKHGPIGSFWKPEGLGNSWDDQIGIADHGERNKADTIRKNAPEVCRYLKSQARFPNAARPGQREQAYIRTLKKGSGRPDILRASEKRRGLSWQFRPG